MGRDVTILFDIGTGASSSNEVLTRISGTYSQMKAIWDSPFEIPPNAGLKALNIERFKAEYSKNWQMEFADVSVRMDEFESIPCRLIGPYGFTADVFSDTVVLNHWTRWGAFERDEKILKRFIETAKLVAEALQSTRVIFLPDSGGEAEDCLDLPYKGYGFRELFECLNDTSVSLRTIEFASSSKILQMYAIDV